MIARLTILLGIAIAALTLPACGSIDNAGSKTASFAVADDHLTISEKSGGDIELHPGDVDEVEVTRWFSGDQAEATWELEDDELVLATDCGFLSPCNVRYQVVVPRDLKVALGTSNGNVTASEFSTALAIRTENGDITVNDTSGALSLSSTSGHQSAAGLSSSNVRAQAENGRIELAFKDVPSNVAVTTDNGAVMLQLPDHPYSVVSTTDNGSVKNALNTDEDGSHRIEVRTENGDIDLRAG